MAAFLQDRTLNLPDSVSWGELEELAIHYQVETRKSNRTRRPRTAIWRDLLLASENVERIDIDDEEESEEMQEQPQQAYEEEGPAEVSGQRTKEEHNQDKKRLDKHVEEDDCWKRMAEETLGETRRGG